MRLFSGWFSLIFAMVFIIVLVGIATTVFLGAKCYASGNPNDMACYMISERYEFGVRQR
jgi:hypothetical protein